MAEYILVTDSAADLPAQMTAHLGVAVISLHVFMKDTPAAPCTLQGKAFYDELATGRVACTAAANLSAVRKVFEEILAAGKDILYLSFSSQLSCMYATVRLAAEELAEEYPERTIRYVDTLCGGMGQGLMVYSCAEMRERGCTLEEVAAYAEASRLGIVHLFTVDDLLYLRRGGRLSAVSAYTGTLLGIKPVLSLNNQGKIVISTKARGKKAAIAELTKRYGAGCTEKEKPVFLAHANAPEYGEQLKAALQKEGAMNVVVGEISPALGAHCGPGAVSLFYFGKSRE